MANWASLGIGVGAFSEGLMNGVKMGNMLGEARDKREVRAATKAGMEQAKQQRQQDIDSQIKPVDVPMVADNFEGPVQAADMAGPPQQAFDVKGKRYDTRVAASGAAEKEVGSQLDYFNKVAVPKIAETYLAQGDAAKASAWTQYMEAAETQRGLKDWSKAFRAAQLGQWDDAANYVFEQYKSYDDGIDPVGKEAVKDKTGNITGFNIKLKNKETGEEYAQFIDNETLMNMGLGHFSPQNQFDMRWKQQQDANNALLEVAKDDRKFQRDLMMEGVKSGYRQQEAVTTEQAKAAAKGNDMQAEFATASKILTNAGYSQKEIDAMTPRILGITRQGLGEDEVRAKAIEMLMESDKEVLNTNKFRDMTPEEQQRKIEGIMDLYRMKQAQPPAPGGSTSTPTVVQSGLPMLNADGTIR